MNTRLVALNATLTKATEFAYGDRIVGKALAEGGSKDYAARLLRNRHQEAAVIRAARLHLDPARLGGIGSRNRIARDISAGRGAPIDDYTISGMRSRAARGITGALSRLSKK